MLKNYFKTAWRSLWKNKAYSLLNISGLAIGMAVALIIGLWVVWELSFDKFIPKYEQLYSVKINYVSKQRGISTQTAVAYPLLEVFKTEIPEVKNAVLCDWINSHSLMNGEKKISMNGAMISPEFLTMFEYPMLKGDRASALKETYSIVLTESTAKALFGEEDPMNKMVRIDNRHNLTVTGVMKDVPHNSSLQFSYLVPFDYYVETTEWLKHTVTVWTSQSHQLYVELKPGTNLDQLNAKIKNLLCTKNPKVCAFGGNLFLHPLKKWNLYSDFKNGKSVGGYIDYVQMFSIIGVLVLIIACINFMNLATARSSKRAKEVGIRKAIGSERKQLIIQFLIESILLALISFLMCLFIVQLCIPYFNELAGSFISIPYESISFWMIMLAYVLFTGILAGSRPAFYLSSFHPAKVLKGTIQSTRTAALSRKALVVLQFSCSVALIISTLIVYQQIQYTQQRNNGYNTSRLVTTYMSDDLKKNYDALKLDLLQTGLVERVGKASTSLVNINNNTMINTWFGKKADDEPLSTGMVWVSPDYFSAVGMEIVSGKDFTSVPISDTLSVVVNEAAVEAMGLKEPLNKMINIQLNDRARIIGVVKNAIIRSPYEPVEPVVFTMRPSEFNSSIYVFYRLKPQVDLQQAIATLTKIFDRYNPAYPYDYVFAEEEYHGKFSLELLIGKLAGIFAGIAIFISCLGLFGLAAYTAEQRTKEIGVRKVLGASVLQLWLLLCKDFIVLVLLSCTIASPLVFYFLKDWLQNYTYHISINPFVFIVSACIAILITFITISFQAIKAAVANPVKSLKTE